MKVAGILLVMGVLHGVNLLILPIIDRRVMLNRQLDMQMRDGETRPSPGAVSGRVDQSRS